MSDNPPATIRSRLISSADSVPTLITQAQVMDPALASFLQGKALAGSKTFWAPIVTHLVTWGVGYFGLAWDGATTEAVAGLISCGLMMVARAVATAPITGFFTKGTPK